MASLTTSQIQSIKEHMTNEKSVLSKKFRAKKSHYVSKSILLNELDDYQEVVTYVTKALQILNHPKSYINEPFSYNETPYDLLAVSYFYLGDYGHSYQNAMIAVSMNPEDERLKNNLKLIEQAKKESQE